MSTPRFGPGEIRITDPLAPPVRWGRLRAYVELTKPRIIELLLVTTVPAMVIAAGGWPGTGLAFATVIGGTLSAGGANAINQFLDRDIDRMMGRTRRRPLPTERVTPERALLFGAALGVSGFLWLWATTTMLAAVLSTCGLLFYVFVYTAYLKRATVQNIVIGGAAGAVPPLVGWAAVTDSLALPAWIMFAIIFYWTPPHFWALSLRYKDDYATAGIPMLPVVAGERATVEHIWRYTGILVGVSLLLYGSGAVGAIYLVTAFVLGAVLLWAAWRLRGRPAEAMRFFTWTNVYLASLFAAILLDGLLL